jgi:hypothetical protein
MWTEKRGFPFENFKTLSTFSVHWHLMHCSSISCTSNFYEDLKRLLVDSLITFSLTTWMCASYMEVIVMKRKLAWFSVCLFIFIFGRRGRLEKYNKAKNAIFISMTLLDFFSNYKLSLLCTKHTLLQLLAKELMIITINR